MVNDLLCRESRQRQRMWDDVSAIASRKFNVNLSSKALDDVHAVYLFDTICYQCGLQFITRDYGFNQVDALNEQDLLSFELKTKHVQVPLLVNEEL